MSREKRYAEALGYFNPPDDETQYDLEYLCWLDHLENTLPEMAADDPARPYLAGEVAPWETDGDDGGPTCSACGEALPTPEPLLCDDCLADLIRQCDERTENEHVN